MTAVPGAASTVDNKRIVNRLRRARGQLNAVIEAVERGGECREVVLQLAAVSKALDRAGFAIISTAMRDCITAAEGGADSLSVAELEQLFLTLA